jgi:hypothetical protein
METRARRAREILSLKEENQGMVQEQATFAHSIASLNSQLLSFTRDVPEDVLEKNQVSNDSLVLGFVIYIFV